jgi:hypothetical protein
MLKRLGQAVGVVPPDEEKPECKYGPGCYRKNPAHFAEFSHPWLDADGQSSPKKEKVADKASFDDRVLSCCLRQLVSHSVAAARCVPSVGDAQS